MSSIPEEEFSRVEVVLGNGHRLVIPQVTLVLNYYDDHASPADWNCYTTNRPYYTLDTGKFYNYTVIQGSASEATPIYDEMMRKIYG